jgi:hypothetical protein
MYFRFYLILLKQFSASDVIFLIVDAEQLRILF